MSTVPRSPRALDSPDNYTVAWIAALPIERAAAEAMLDEIHATPAGFIKNHTDKNVYTWGRMGQHNVVIAALPAGIHGVTSAATTASSLLASLPSIRIGLLVGIGGGIARQGRDIRLGDVVVSQPDGTTGGVCQYDLFKAKLGDKIERRGFLKPPPDVLLNALSCIQARHMREDSKVADLLQEMLTKYPKMGRKNSKSPGFTYQGTENDRLFQTSFDHIPGSGCQGCDTAGEVQRDARDSTDPEIHYGIIASGNTLVKDAAARDKIVKDVGEDCLCFEMEAAGLMNQFPCLVIRGICDYADSHKNDQWQQHASATAAAYGKELLLYVPVTEVQETQRALDVLKSIEHKLDDLQHTTAAFVSTSTSERRASKIRSWLQPPDPSSNGNQARRVRHEGTGMWLLKHPNFKSWCSGSHRFSFLHGLAGCGKTILSTTVLDHLARNKEGHILSFFFDFGDSRKQTLDGMLRSLAFQLYCGMTTGANQLDDLFKDHGNGGREPATKAVSDAVCEMLAASTVVHIVLDALDESTRRRQLLDWIEDVASRPDLSHVRLLCTARPEPEFLVRFDLTMGKESWISLDREAAVNADIRAYVAGQLADRREFQEKHLPQDLIKQIVAKVGSGAKGMQVSSDYADSHLADIYRRFRWAACQVNDLAECRSPSMIRDVLEHLPKDLKETYKRMLSKIPDNSKDAAMRLLHFLVHTLRPLSVGEAIEILATNTGTQQPGFDKGSRVFEEIDVLYFCPGLVSIIEVNRSSGIESFQFRPQKELHLAHFSVKEYLRTLEWFQPFTSSVTITKTCLAYLRSVSGDLKTNKTAYPFAELAAEIWTRHAAASESCEEVFQASLAFIEEPKTFRLHQVDMYWRSLDTLSSPQGSRLYYACLGGLKRVAQELVRHGMDVNAEGGLYNNALQACSFCGHHDLVKFLLDEHADVHKKGGKFGNALQAASRMGHFSIVKLLLEQGADVNAQGGQYGHALQAASYRGHFAIVDLLLEKGAHVNAIGGFHGTALSAASCNGKPDIWRLLVAKGADIRAQGGNWGNALQAASESGHFDIVKLLVEMGMDVNTPSGEGRYERIPLGCILTVCFDGALDDPHGTALTAASNGGYANIVELLLSNGAHVNADNALWAASRKGHRNIVEQLLDKGAYVEGTAHADGTYNYGTPLYIASDHGHVDTVRLLLERGADATTQSGCGGGSALEVASRAGRVDIVEALLGAGADLHAEAGSALWAAAESGQLDVVEILLDSGAAIRDSLYAAMIGGHDDIVKLLLKRGADVEPTALWAAASQGRSDMVELFWERRPDLVAQDGDLDDTLRAAVFHGHGDIVELLLRKGANADVHVDNGYGNALQTASRRGHLKVVKLLLQGGADVNARSGKFGTALQAAFFAGRYTIVELLLKSGARMQGEGVIVLGKGT